MVEVTRSNFDALLPEIAEKIRAATFVAVDAEYTGIYSEDLSSSIKLFDNGEERYRKVRDNVSKFGVCQYGLAIFRKDNDASSNVYKADAYKFYVFPVTFDAFAKRELLSCQISCLNFLARHDFDFNKFFKHGIPYLNKEKSEALRSFLKTNRHIMYTSETLEPATQYFPPKQTILDDEEIEEIINGLAGFSKVFDVITDAGIPLVGHNFLNDLLFTYHLFFANLPESYEEFKSSVQQIFPIIYDTKFLAREVHKMKINFHMKDNVLQETNLFSLYTSTHVVKNGLYIPYIQLNGDAQTYRDALFIGRRQNLEKVPNNSCHSADFDAIVTGCVFLNVCNMACDQKLSTTLEYQRNLPPTFCELRGKTERWSNKLQVARAVIPYIELTGKDPETHRPNWIIVKSINSGRFIDPVKLKLDLVKYGDMEIEQVTEIEVVIACGTKACQQRVWRDLEKKGFNLVELTVKSSSKKTGLAKLWNGIWSGITYYKTISLCGAIMAFVLLKITR